MNKNALLPVVFVGHGSPMNAIEDNFWSRAQIEMGAGLPLPKAILAVSAHWYVRGLRTTVQKRPATIHDFRGFPRELFEFEYPASGSPELAERVAGLLAAEGAQAVDDWGLDHGTWAVLARMFPRADVPVVQLSIDPGLSSEAHVEIGRKLSVLRREGVLIVASGNVVHNLAYAMRSMSLGDSTVPEWVSQFDERTRKALSDRDQDALVSLVEQPIGRLAHPIPDHWMPLMVAYGASSADDPMTFPVEGFDLGSLSMRSVRWG